MLIFIQTKAIQHKNLLGYFSLDIVCSKNQTVVQEQSSRKTLSIKEQIMSRTKLEHIFMPNGGSSVNYPSNFIGACEKKILHYNLPLTAHLGCSLFNAVWYNLMNK